MALLANLEHLVRTDPDLELGDMVDFYPEDLLDEFADEFEIDDLSIAFAAASTHRSSSIQMEEGPSPQSSTTIPTADGSALNEENFPPDTSQNQVVSSAAKPIRTPKVLVRAALKHGCGCDHACLSRFSEEEVLKIRTNWENQHPQPKDKRQFLLDYLANEMLPDGSIRLRCQGRGVCRRAYLLIYDWHERTFRRIVTSFNAGTRNADHPTKGEKMDGALYNDVITWIKNYIDKAADYMPNSGEVHLPKITSLVSIYEEFASTSVNIACLPGLSYFKKLFRDHFSDKCRIVKSSTMSKCDKCCALKEDRLRTNPKDRIAMQLIRERMAMHLHRQQLQRRHFNNMIQEAVQDPDRLLCWHSDGMDQAKTLLPAPLIRYSSLDDDTKKLKVHIFGTWAFGREDGLQFVLDFNEFSHNANQNATALLNTLYQYRERLPRKLHLQFDNTCSQNKNKIIFQFVALLVELKVFDLVTMNFLMKGHTHSHMDRIFSSVSSKLGRSNTLTVEDLCQQVQSSWAESVKDGQDITATTRPACQELGVMWDFKGWLEPHGTDIKKLHPYHCFMFKLDRTDDKCLVTYKRWVEDQWKPDPKLILETRPDPTEIPLLQKPNYQNAKLQAAKLGVEKAIELGAIKPPNTAVWEERFRKFDQNIAYWKSLPSVKSRQVVRKERKPAQNNTKDTTEKEKEGGDNVEIVEYCKAPTDIKFPLFDVLEARRAVPDPLLLPEREHNRSPSPDPVVTKADKRKRGVAFGQCTKANLEIRKFVTVKPNLEKCLADQRKSKGVRNSDHNPCVRPWLAKVTGPVDDNGEFTIVWYQGNLRGQFTQMRFEERISVEQVQQYNITLLKFNKLPSQHIKVHLELNADLGRQFEQMVLQERNVPQDASRQEPLVAQPVPAPVVAGDALSLAAEEPGLATRPAPVVAEEALSVTAEEPLLTVQCVSESAILVGAAKGSDVTRSGVRSPEKEQEPPEVTSATSVGKTAPPNDLSTSDLSLLSLELSGASDSDANEGVRPEVTSPEVANRCEPNHSPAISPVNEAIEGTNSKENDAPPSPQVANSNEPKDNQEWLEWLRSDKPQEDTATEDNNPLSSSQASQQDPRPLDEDDIPLSQIVALKVTRPDSDDEPLAKHQDRTVSAPEPRRQKRRSIIEHNYMELDHEADVPNKKRRTTRKASKKK